MARPSPWELWTLMFELSTALMTEVEGAVRRQGLEMKEFFLVGKMDEHPYPAELARVLLTPKPSITFMVKRLESVGFVQRRTEKGDLRRFRLTLTRAGRKALEASRAIVDEAFAKRLGRLKAGQGAELARVLKLLKE